MGAQERSRRHGTEFTLETKLNRGSLPRVRHDANNFFRIQNLTHRHGNGSPGNFRNIGEPSLANLLATADFVKVDDQISGFRLEVRGRLVNSQVAILPPTPTTNLNLRPTHHLAHTPAHF